MKNALIIFVKNPEAGKVKTRLAKDIGDFNAACLYRVFAETVIANTKSRSFTRYIFYSPPHRKKEITEWIGTGFCFFPQKGADLGERMYNAFKCVFGEGAKKAVIIGTDMPHIKARAVKEAFSGLEKNDCMIGPAEDGGYYLLGMSRPCRGLFKDIDWSTNRVFRQTVSRMEALGLSYSIMGEGFDIDDIDGMRKAATFFSMPAIR